MENAELIGTVVVVTEWIKSLGFIPKNTMPIVAVFIGIAVSVLQSISTGLGVVPAVTQGATAGFIATYGYRTVASVASKASQKSTKKTK